MWLVRATLFLVLASVLAGQPELRLKSRGTPRTRTRQSESRARQSEARRLGSRPLIRRNLGQAHWIVQFPSAPDFKQLDELRSRGARILGYVPDFAYSVVAPDNARFNGLGLYSFGTLQADEKTSPILDLSPDPSIMQIVVVEFYPDVDMNDARKIVLDRQMQIQENPDLLPHHLLVNGNSDQVAGLGQWDEVAYVFPASDELTQGVPTHACAGALTDQGTVGQSILRVGEGWDGPGKTGADLSYAFLNTTPKLAPEDVTSEIVRAFSEWARYAKLTFTPSGDPQASRTLAVLFASRAHGDGYAFDGPGGILAHTYYPFPMNPEPIAGDLHFDADESWNIGSNVDLFSVALHETGHALGLGHSDKPGSVMYPYYRKSTTLTDEDIAALLSMYAAQDGTPGGAAALELTIDQPALSIEASITLHGVVSGGSGQIQVTWTSDRGSAGVANGGNNWTAGPIPLSLGSNTITMTAKDAAQTQVVHAITVTRKADSGQPTVSGPQVDITAPAGPLFNSSVNTVSLTGTASSPSGITRVMWTNSRGGSGQAAGTINWSTGPLMLQNGINTFTITAFAQNGTTALRTIQVGYSTGAANDAAPPALTIVTPALTTLSTPASSIALSGTARDNAGVATVTWTSSTGPSGTAAGTTSWSIPAIPLLVGANTITVRATNLAGVAAWRSIVVTRL